MDGWKAGWLIGWYCGLRSRCLDGCPIQLGSLEHPYSRWGASLEGMDPWESWWSFNTCELKEPKMLSQVDL